MTRIGQLKITYVAINVALVVSIGIIIFSVPKGHWATYIVPAIVTLFLIRRYQLRKLYRAGELFTNQHYEQAIVAFESFIGDVDMHPSINWWYSFNWAIYTHSSKAIAWLNIAVCHAYLKD